MCMKSDFVLAMASGKRRRSSFITLLVHQGGMLLQIHLSKDSENDHGSLNNTPTEYVPSLGD